MSLIGITGAAGFIGRAVRAQLETAGDRLILVDDLTGPVSAVEPGVDLLRADFASERALHRLADADAILHLAAVSGVVACAQDPEGSRRSNVEGTERLARMCRERKIPLAFASSCSVVGRPEQLPIVESTPARPTHEYARQKADGERIVEANREDSVPSLSLRMSNLYGAYRYADRWVTKGNVLTLFLRQAREGVLRVNAPGTQRRDFIHIEDVARAWAVTAHRLAGRTGPVGLERLLLASGESCSVLELAEMVRRIHRSIEPDRPPITIRTVPNPRGEIELLDERFETDPSRTWAWLGFRPAHHLADEIQERLRSPVPE
ncbi:MAG: NAD-dependent epimerase/dehydratase [Thermoplasmata archaeon]